MNTLVQGYLPPANDFQLNCYSKSVLSEENHVFKHQPDPGLKGFSVLTNDNESPSSEGWISNDSESSSEAEGFKEADQNVDSPTDHSDAMLKFISQMLMEEEDLENKPCMLQHCLALQATEKSLYDALNNNPHPNPVQNVDSRSSSDSNSFVDSCNAVEGFESLINPVVPYPSLSFGSSFPVSNSFASAFLGCDSEPKEKTGDYYRGLVEKVETGGDSSGNSRGKKNRFREEGDSSQDHRSNKQLANYSGEYEPLEMYDNVLLCSNLERLSACGEAEEREAKKKSEQSRGSNRGRPRGGNKKQGGVVKEVVDLRSLLMQCAQAVASYDSRTVNDLLLRIRQHSSPLGDGTERVAYYFANALEARLAGTGTRSYATFHSMRISAAEILKAYQTYITACPFRKMSNLFANKTIRKLANGASTLHIVDFGILYGFQWPCLIQTLSERPGGPPKLRITGIDFPQPGFRPAERVEDTGRRLAKYCQRFGVPFEYNAIAQKWETIRLEELRIEKNELLVVNSLYRLHNVPDETVIASSPRDAVLDLVKRINPDMFIHGVVNGTYNTPFFVTRFREALFHFSSMFDLFDATTPREDQNRLRFEEEILGKDSMNIIACEGTERVDRPETYKQWQVRTVRAGFKQLPLDREIVKYVRNKVKTNYLKEFSVDEDGQWMLQGWKGRVLHAISYWKSSSHK